MPTDPSNPLLPRIAAGDPDAVGACIDEFGPIIYTLARRYLTPVKGDVEGAVQEVFIEVWKNAARFDPARGSEASFVMTLAHRRLIDKRRWHASRFSVGEPGPDATPPDARTAQTTVELRDEARTVAAALDRLPADERTVIRLSIYSGLSHERIAVAVGAPVGTVKTRIRRGLERLRRECSQTQAPDPTPHNTIARHPDSRVQTRRENDAREAGHAP